MTTMTQYAIRVDQLGKQYQLGQDRKYKALRDTLTDALYAPARALRRLWQRPRAEGNRPETFWALRDVGFDVRPGEVVGIIGRNGAGKSTLLKLLSRITEPTTGAIDLYGRVGSLLEVGTGFHPELTGRENVYLNGGILGMKRTEIQRKFDDIVAFAEVEKFLDTPVKHYSSGMYVRLAFAVAAHLEPEILIVDEVLAVGDASFQRKCLNKMQDVSGHGRTVLFVSHNMPAVVRLCSRGLLLEAGQVVADGRADEVAARYLSNAADGGTGRTWETGNVPGNADLRLRHVGLYLDDGAPAPGVVGVGDALHLRLRYEVRTPGIKFRCAALFFTQGVCAFASVEPTESEKPTSGTYETTVTVPSHLLAEGEYSVNVSIFASRGAKSHLVSERDVLVFQVVDPLTGPSARGDYTERLAGVVRPRLEWHTERTGAR